MSTGRGTWRSHLRAWLVVVLLAAALVPVTQAATAVLPDGMSAPAAPAAQLATGPLASAGAWGQPAVYASVLNDTSPPLTQLCQPATFTPTPPITATRTATPTATATPPIPTPTVPLPTPLRSFEGMSAFNAFRGPDVDLPADTNGVIGRNHFVQSVNFGFQVFDRDGNPLIAPVSSSCFWNGFGGACEGGFWSDMVVLYDRDADR
jgi:hypothetical protein